MAFLFSAPLSWPFCFSIAGVSLALLIWVYLRFQKFGELRPAFAVFSFFPEQTTERTIWCGVKPVVPATREATLASILSLFGIQFLRAPRAIVNPSVISTPLKLELIGWRSEELYSMALGPRLSYRTPTGERLDSVQEYKRYVLKHGCPELLVGLKNRGDEDSDSNHSLRSDSDSVHSDSPSPDNDAPKFSAIKFCPELFYSPSIQPINGARSLGRALIEMTFAYFGLCILLLRTSDCTFFLFASDIFVQQWRSLDALNGATVPKQWETLHAFHSFRDIDRIYFLQTLARVDTFSSDLKLASSTPKLVG